VVGPADDQKVVNLAVVSSVDGRKIVNLIVVNPQKFVNSLWLVYIFDLRDRQKCKNFTTVTLVDKDKFLDFTLASPSDGHRVVSLAMGER